jgi:hypothetical protein
MSKIKPSTTHALQRRHTPNGAVQAMTQIVDFEVVNDGDSVYIMYWYTNADAPLIEESGGNFVPIPHNGINLRPNHGLLFNREQSRSIWNKMVQEGWTVAADRSKW